ncbi:MAG: hypothetical protein CL908_22530 [Deltaproteobacteria bacterium]|jgi:curved DNA-binding protein CbpA|nr:hypothetical protein [Deltaproteobacteria bacterium]
MNGMKGIDELDYYELLEIPRMASAGEIDRAYRVAQQTYAEGSLALYGVFEKQDAASIRERLDEAYAVLADLELRERYDGENPENHPDVVAMTSGQAPLFDGAAGSMGGTYAAAASAIDDAVIGSLDEAVEEFDALEDDGRGEFDGVRLRRTRLFRGYELDDISDVTKVSGFHLQNIEEENFGDLPADVYVRGFVTAYAKTIGLDPVVVVPSYMARVKESRSGDRRSGFLGRA